MNQMTSEKYLNFFLLMVFWKFQHFNLVSKISQKLFKPLPCHKSIGKMLHVICISAVEVSLRWANCGQWASCFFFVTGGTQLILAYSWARPAVLAAGKCRGGILLFLLFLHFLSFPSFFPIPLFHLLYYLFYLFSPFLSEMAQNDPQGWCVKPPNNKKNNLIQ